MEPPNCIVCPNCKKDVPEINYQLHSVYCARKLKVCQQCKEPVPITDMEKHSAQVPCPQCGEVMQACDVPSHKSDACSLTEVQCAYCELLLPRNGMAEHELYCGTRTEACAECKELVMFKYKKLHEESNHRFLKLEDEPGPLPSWEVPPKNRGSSARKIPAAAAALKKEPTTMTGLLNGVGPSEASPANGSSSRGAIKKRTAPQPPSSKASPTAGRPTKASSGGRGNAAAATASHEPPPLPAWEAMKREQRERREREVENELRRANGLPPVLTTAQKVDKLRKMSKLSGGGGDYDEPPHRQKAASNKKSNEAIMMQTESLKNRNAKSNNVEAQIEAAAANGNDFGAFQSRKDVSAPKTSGEERSLRVFNYNHESDTMESRSPNDFDRFAQIKSNLCALRKDLQECRLPSVPNKAPVKKENVESIPRDAALDNLGLFKLSSETASAPLSPVDKVNKNSKRSHVKAAAPKSPVVANEPPQVDAAIYDSGLDGIMLPCEFCEKLIEANFLVAHETGCRPQITSYAGSAAAGESVMERNLTKTPKTEKVDYFERKTSQGTVKSKSNGETVLVPPEDLNEDVDNVKIPCEFCMSLVPAYQLVWHQETCLRS